VLEQTGTTTTTEGGGSPADVLRDLTSLDRACGDDPSWVCRQVFERTENATLAGAAEWLVARPLAIAAVVLVALVASRVSRWAIKRVMQRSLGPKATRRRDWVRAKTPNVLLRTEEWNLRAEARVQTLTVVFRSLASLFIWFVAIIWILDILQVNLGPVIAGAGIAGIALGFGAQNMVRDFLSGFFLIAEDQLGVGDIVDLGPEAQGVVEKVTLRSTRLRDVEGTVWHVPNGQIVRVGNKSQEWARALLDIDVSYDSDIEAAQRCIAETAEAMAADPRWRHEILETPEVWGIEALGPNSVSVRLVVKTRPASQFAVMRELRWRIKRDFDEQGIVIPFAQLTIHNESPPNGDGDGDGAAPASPPPPSPSSPAARPDRP
jgi:moderate conductance mechanosensitive channel